MLLEALDQIKNSRKSLSSLYEDWSTNLPLGEEGNISLTKKDPID
jgi:hypothetical protein